MRGAARVGSDMIGCRACARVAATSERLALRRAMAWRSPVLPRAGRALRSCSPAAHACQRSRARALQGHYHAGVPQSARCRSQPRRPSALPLVPPGAAQSRPRAGPPGARNLRRPSRRPPRAHDGGPPPLRRRAAGARQRALRRVRHVHKVPLRRQGPGLRQGHGGQGALHCVLLRHWGGFPPRGAPVDGDRIVRRSGGVHRGGRGLHHLQGVPPPRRGPHPRRRPRRHLPGVGFPPRAGGGDPPVGARHAAAHQGHAAGALGTHGRGARDHPVPSEHRRPARGGGDRPRL
mmetsp:Transcript_11256/g.38358  ORF Transcript_11256/g.38358 Transcript_11256/m.38358 type:complete len:291 (+) Transcript_11256:659-1531(+)